MSTSRMQDEIFDLHEINASIVKRQKMAIAMLEEDAVNQRDCDEIAGAERTEWIINVLRGDSVPPPAPTRKVVPPYISSRMDGPRVVVTFWWGGDDKAPPARMEMYDDQALRMARDINDVLEGRAHDAAN